MATSKYIIRKNKASLNKDGTTLILLRLTHRGKTTYFSTSISIPIKDWDHENQCIKRTLKGFTTLNMRLNKFRQTIDDFVNKAIFEGIEPTVKYIRKKYENRDNKRKQRKESRDFDWEEFKDIFVEESRRTKKPSTIRSYTDFLNVLELYKNNRKIKTLDFEDFTMDWYYDFMDFYIYERGANNNTFGKMIKTLKTFLNSATDSGYNSFTEFKDKRFKVYQEEVSHIYLNEEEIQQLLDLNLCTDKKKEVVRDLFVIGCYTGLRFGDFKQIKGTNIRSSRLRIKTNKTGQVVVIPFHPIVKSLIEKYNGEVPKPYCNMVTNRELKNIGKMAGFFDIVVQSRTHGTERKEKTFEKWELLSTHCARRSFATNLYKQGFPSISIMKITGHKSEKSFMRYIKVSEDEVASMLEIHWNQQLNQAS